jgi:hypothetical protein
MPPISSAFVPYVIKTMKTVIHSWYGSLMVSILRKSERTAPIGASNHGDQNPERLSLLDYKKKRSINPQGAIGIRTSF